MGVELAPGPGGVPTGNDRASCLVSGGRHSSVLAWQAVLMGYRVRLVHAREDDEALIAVAELYSELSFRSDPRGLSLTVVEGKPDTQALRRLASRGEDPVFAGLTAPRGRATRLSESGAVSPLYLLSEEWFDSEFKKLGIRESKSAMDWGTGKGTKAKSFGGKRAGVSEVLDGLS